MTTAKVVDADEQDGEPHNSTSTVLPLPPIPQLTGVTEHRDKNFSVKVSHGNGYMAHIDLEATWDSTPDVIFDIFTYPDNSALFRDIKRVGKRKVVSSQPGLKVVDVMQIGEMRVLWMVREYSTWLRVTEDTRDEACLSIQFELLKSDILGRFNGRWDFYQRKNNEGAVTGCRGVFTQDILPAGMPPYLTRIPVLGSILRGVTARAISRILEDMNSAEAKVVKGLKSGKAVQHTLNELCGACNAEAGYSNGQVRSFEIDDVDEEDEDGEGAGSLEPCLAAHIEVHSDGTVGLHLILNPS